jgi:hypothetical protein
VRRGWLCAAGAHRHLALNVTGSRPSGELLRHGILLRGIPAAAPPAPRRAREAESSPSSEPSAPGAARSVMTASAMARALELLHRGAESVQTALMHCSNLPISGRDALIANSDQRHRHSESCSAPPHAKSRLPLRHEDILSSSGTERARHARSLSIKVHEVAAGHGKFGGIVDVLVRGASHVRSRSRSTFSRLS